MLLKSLVRAFLPMSLRQKVYKVRQALRPDTLIIDKPSYAEDGLVSGHVSEFLDDPRFAAAYDWSSKWLKPGDSPRFRTYVACWAAEHALGLPGDFVECGVGPSVMSGTICRYLDFAGVAKRMYLYDTFKGEPSLKDGAEVFDSLDLYDAHFGEDLLGRTIEKFKEFPNVEIVPGSVPGVLFEKAPAKVSYLSIDMNNAAAEIAAIEFFWERLVPGAIILLDDYAYGAKFMEQKRAWDKFAASKSTPILTLPTGQGLMIARNIL